MRASVQVHRLPKAVRWNEWLAFLRLPAGDCRLNWWLSTSLLLHVRRCHENVLSLEDERHSILVLNDLECWGAGQGMDIDVMN